MITLPQSSEKDARAREGARKVLRDCLALETGDRLVVFCDETTTAPSSLIHAEAIDRRVDAEIREIPVRRQLAAAEGQTQLLSPADQASISSARAILTCLSDEPGATRSRQRLVEIATDQNRRVGHMPGATVSMLADAINIDYKEAQARCEALAIALLLGEQASVYSYYSPGHPEAERSRRLNVRLGGISRPPVTSTGKIALGTWGNLPGGETFIAPIEWSTSGSYLLTGSFRSRPINGQDCLEIVFDQGRLVDCAGPVHLKQEFLSLLASGPAATEQENPLAELGIGVNPLISPLTGTSLIDEKALGTCHIAIGSNMAYGGSLEHSMHEDLVTLSPSIDIDGKAILSRGQLSVRVEDWIPKLTDVRINDNLQDSHTVVRRTGVLTQSDADGGLQVRREVAAGRHCVYRLGVGPDSAVIRKVLDLIPPFPSRTKVSQLLDGCRNLSVPDREVLASLRLLVDHHLVSATKRDS